MRDSIIQRMSARAADLRLALDLENTVDAQDSAQELLDEVERFLSVEEAREEPWLNDRVQFARLLSEIIATQEVDVALLEDSMDLYASEIDKLFERAHVTWEQAKGSIERDPDIEVEVTMNDGTSGRWVIDDEAWARVEKILGHADTLKA